MKVTEMVRGGKEYLSIIVVPLKCNQNGNTVKTGKQASFQIRNKGAKDVLKIKEILQFMMTHKGVSSIYRELKKKGHGWVNSGGKNDTVSK